MRPPAPALTRSPPPPRRSVCSAVGALPLALHYGFDQVAQFLQGAHAMDQHFFSAPLDKVGGGWL